MTRSMNPYYMDSSRLHACRFPALELIDDIANILWTSFQTKIHSDSFVSADDIFVPPGWSRQLAIDCEHLAYVLAIAYLNHSMLFFQMVMSLNVKNYSQIALEGLRLCPCFAASAQWFSRTSRRCFCGYVSAFVQQTFPLGFYPIFHCRPRRHHCCLVSA